MGRARAAVYDAGARLSHFRASRHRRRLAQVTFVGITGSCGKTTTKDLVAAVLGSRHRVVKSPGTHNAAHWVSRTVLAVRPQHDYCVQELGASGPGTLDEPIGLVHPSVAVITNIGGDHRKAFRTLAATAAEKRKLVEAVPADGVAVLNADDPLVLAMREHCRGRVITYGLARGAMVRGERVASTWPASLSFAVVHESQSLTVETRFHGTHWVHHFLAALATGVALGMPLADAVAAVATVDPWSGRMNPVVADGVTFIRDDCKASLWSVAPALEFLRSARASRRIVVFGTLSDYGGRASTVYSSVARQALDFADEVLFVGPQAHRCEGARSHANARRLRSFGTLREAEAYLRAALRPGDLVLLKGSQRADHLLRLILALTGPMACWRTSCRRLKFCNECVLLRVPELAIGPRPSLSVPVAALNDG